MGQKLPYINNIGDLQNKEKPMLNYKIVKVKHAIEQKELPSVKDDVVIFDIEGALHLNSMFFGYCIINRDRVILMKPNRLANELIRLLCLESMLNICETEEEEAIKKAKEIIDKHG